MPETARGSTSHMEDMGAIQPGCTAADAWEHTIRSRRRSTRADAVDRGGNYADEAAAERRNVAVDEGDGDGGGGEIGVENGACGDLEMTAEGWRPRDRAIARDWRMERLNWMPRGTLRKMEELQRGNRRRRTFRSSTCSTCTVAMDA
ncbi:hypothetical protein KSP40_PGU020507 [Platanthera guangdongensis]|uniref:Uncharacterized protein n=1 Tax=Platanthera guangdongensis TaxID=2320717 RepID=A0ABR2MDG3_9ASPA